MASKREKKKDKKKKKKLTDKQILKLLKALKPQTQQIVRVNVGDKGDKKKKPGEVQSSYNPPFVFPSQPQPAIINLGQAPAPYAPIPQPQKTLEAPSNYDKEIERIIQMQNDLAYQVQQEAVRARKEQELREPSETFNIRIKKRVPSEQPTMEQFFRPREEFKAPKIRKESQLSASSKQPSKITELPSNNDPFLPVSIQRDTSVDQMGNAAAGLSSEEFMFSPEGEVPLEVQQTEMAAEPTVEPAAASVELQPADVFQEENPDVFSVEEKPVLKAPAELPPVKTTKPRTEPSEVITKPWLKTAPNISMAVMREQINNAIIDDGYDGVPAEYRSNRTATKGQLKSGIKMDELRKLYEDYLKS